MVLKGIEQRHLQGFVEELILQHRVDVLYYITEFDTVISPQVADRVQVLPVNLLDKLPFLNWDRYLPIDAPLISRLKAVESIVMTMFERSYAFHHSYIFRRRAYLQLLRFWNTIISQGTFVGFVADILPHAPIDHTLFGLCHELGLPKMYFDNLLPGFITVWHYWDQTPQGLSPSQIHPAPDAVLSHRAELVLRSQTGQKGEAVPYYMDPTFWSVYQKNAKARLRWRILNKPRTAAEKRQLKSPAYLLLQAERYLKSKIRLPLKSWLLKQQLTSYSQHVDPERVGRYLYVALHMQPEVSSGPRAGAYVDQHLIVEQLSACVPEDLILIVKENPKQTGLYRDRYVYRDLSRLRNVVLVPKEQDTFDLIANCLAIVTSTGTVGWEGLFRGKPVLCFGYPFYQAAQGVRVVMTTEQVRRAIDDLVAGDWDLPDQGSTVDFLKTLDRVAIRGNLDGHREHLLPSPPGLLEELHRAIDQQLAVE